MTPIQSCLAQNMKYYRKRLKLSQAALAEKAGAASNYIALIEVGKSFPSFQMLEKIAAALEVDALDLFNRGRLIMIDMTTLQTELVRNVTKSIEETIHSHSSAH